MGEEGSIPPEGLGYCRPGFSISMNTVRFKQERTYGAKMPLRLKTTKVPHHQRRIPPPSKPLPFQEFARRRARRLREDSVVTAAARRFPQN